MDLQSAKLLKTGDTLITPQYSNADGTPQRWKVTSIKTWKTRPTEISIGLKRGLKEYAKINQNQLHLISK